MSYVLTMKEDFVDIMKDWHVRPQSEEGIVYDKMKELILEGSRITVNEEVLYAKEIKFDTRDIILSDYEGFDFETLDDEKLLLYIFGEYIYRGKITKLGVFGRTLTDHH